MTKKKQKPLKIYLLSGGTGRTGDLVLNAALAQFTGEAPQIVRRLKVRSARSAVKTVNDAAKANAVLFHTIVAPEVREAVIETAAKEDVPAVDILGPALRVLEDHLQTRPQSRAGLSHELRKEHFNRIEAVDFTLAHDDGCLVRELAKADVVLVGASRVSKSVTCFYLAYRGVRAANVPIVGFADPPEELLGLDPSKVIGLTMNARRLTRLREARMAAFGGAAHEAYVDQREVARELSHVLTLMEENGWRCIDVSYKSVEEVAREVAQMIGK